MATPDVGAGYVGRCCHAAAVLTDLGAYQDSHHLHVHVHSGGRVPV